MKNKEFHDSYKLNIYEDGSIDFLNGLDEVIASKPPFDEIENDPGHPGRISNLKDFVDELDLFLDEELMYMKRHNSKEE